MTRENRGAEAPKYMRLAIRHTRRSAGWPGDAIGRVPLYTKESRCQVIAPVRFEVCLAPEMPSMPGDWGAAKACEI